jgi:hypothetical protein
MPFSRRTTTVIKLLVVALGVILCILAIAKEIQIGGEAMGSTRVSDFSLCAPTESRNGGSATLTPRVISPTSAVYVCGYLSTEIRNPAAKRVCLGFYLTRGGRLIYSRDYCRDTAGFFNVPIESDELFLPGQYSIRLIDVARRNWDEVITFTVQR